MEHFISSAGYLAVLVLAIAESACVPIPSEVTMLFGGALAASGKVTLPGIIATGVGGEVIGSYVAWWVARAGGRAAVERFGRYVLLTPEDLDRATRFFERKGPATVFVGRILPFVRTFISLPAGLAQMGPLSFGIFTAAGSAVWMTALGVAGYELGPRWHSVVKGFHGATYVIVAVVVLGIAGLAVHRYRKIHGNPVVSAVADSPGGADGA